MSRTSKPAFRLSDADRAASDAARAAARARFAHLAENPGGGTQPTADSSDPDSPPMTDKKLARLRPAADVVPGLVAASLRKGGRPRSETPKVAVSIRLDADLLDALRAGGDGWQSRVNAALRKSMGLDT